MPMMTDTALKIAGLGFALAILCLAAEAMSGLGTRWGLWDYRTGLSLLKWATAFAMAAALFCIFAGVSGYFAHSGTAWRLSLAGLLICIGALIQPANMMLAVQRLPYIHDISTDTENPPKFDKIMKLRQDAPNPAEYGGAEVAEKQHKAYPDIKPLIMETSADKAFAGALTVAGKMGWKIVNTDPAGLIIEATDTTFWFGFKDDIVIRIAPQGSVSRVDVRSVSRVGRSDIGANAERIREFINKLRGHTE